MTATDRAMAREEWEHMDAKDARIRELEAEIERLKGQPLTAAATAYWSGKVAEREGRIRELEAEVERVHRCAICGTGQPHRKLTDAEDLVAKRIFEFAAFADNLVDEVERLRDALGLAPETDEIQPTEEER